MKKFERSKTATKPYTNEGLIMNELQRVSNAEVGISQKDECVEDIHQKYQAMGTAGVLLVQACGVWAEKIGEAEFLKLARQGRLPFGEDRARKLLIVGRRKDKEREPFEYFAELLLGNAPGLGAYERVEIYDRLIRHMKNCKLTKLTTAVGKLKAEWDAEGEEDDKRTDRVLTSAP